MGQSSSASAPLALPELALHCLRVAEGSPADTLLEPFFDYVVGIDAAGGPNTPTDEVALEGQGVGELARVVEANEGRRVVLRVYNAKTQRVREVAVTPSRTWGDAQDAGKKSLLGLTMRVCNPAQALESVWHILEVLEGSPAEHIDKPLRLYVYSADLDNLREVVVIPNEKWGGSGLLGCGVGYGILHRIPRPATPPPRADGYFMPADAAAPALVSPLPQVAHQA
ncbi:hypothetical protein Q5752_000726 [Cryptotrichosporon argae]